MRKDLTKILNKLYAIEILQAIPEVSDDFVGPPEQPKERPIELWELIDLGYSCDCEKILRDHRIPAITIYGTKEDGPQGTHIFRPIVSSISISDIEAAFNTNQMQNFLAARICEKYNPPPDPQKAKEDLAFIEDWLGTAEGGITEDELAVLPNPWLFDDGIWDLVDRLGQDEMNSCISPCFGVAHDLFTKLVRIAREKHGIELANSVPSLNREGVPRSDPFWGARYPALKTIMAKVINCVKEKLKRVIQEGTTA